VGYLFWGHAATWIIIVLYTVYLIRETKKLERKLEDIEK